MCSSFTLRLKLKSVWQSRIDGFNLLWECVGYTKEKFIPIVYFDVRHCFLFILAGNVIYALDGVPAFEWLSKSPSKIFINLSLVVIATKRK